MSSFDKRMAQEVARRDQATQTLKDAVSTGSTSVNAEVTRLTDISKVEELIKAHPIMAAGVALGAGVIVSKLLISGKAAAVHSEPQRVVIEVKHGGETVGHPAPAPAPAKGFNLVEFITKAAAGYETVQNMLRNFAASQAQAQSESQGAPVESEPAPL